MDKYKAHLRVSYQAATSPTYGEMLKEKTLGFNTVYEKNIIKVPKELIPFWAKSGENLYYAKGEFNRDL